ncbi:MAG: tetratricopeptide repeat protein [Cyanobacteria bacterium REEB67]|nr:tetratricopeptide repeat protein [Cyanobacteria bacterium REEB67]
MTNLLRRCHQLFREWPFFGSFSFAFILLHSIVLQALRQVKELERTDLIRYRLQGYAGSMIIRSKKQALTLLGTTAGISLIAAGSMHPLRLDIARRFYDWGITYKAMGWPAGSREAFNCAALFGQGDPVATAALRYRDTKLPVHPVPGDAIEMNINGYNANKKKDRGSAIYLFRECIRRYPDFEWPYNNLCSLYIDEGKYAQAEKYGLQAIAINPKYVNALVNMAILKDRQDDLTAARTYLDRALAADPTDAGAVRMNASLKLEELRAKDDEVKERYTGQ